MNQEWEKEQRTAEIYIITLEDIDGLFAYLCKHSIYAYAEELKRGYLTVTGGHRIGIAGEMTEIKAGEVALRHVYYMNIRIARNVKGAANGVLQYLYQKGRLQSTLFISPPGYGKTTVLRDAIRQISNGNSWGRGQTLAVIDERMELSGGEASQRRSDIGVRTDILSGCLKQKGIMMVLRSMGPEVIAVDEIGSREDLEALRQAANCGCSLLATMHGHETCDEQMKKKLNYFKEYGLFTRYIYLGKQTSRPCRNIVLDEYGEVLN